MNDHAVFVVIVGSLACAALVAAGVVGHLIWLREHQERGQG